MNNERSRQPLTLEQTIARIEALSEEYRLDTEMSSDRARLYMGWLDETVATVEEISPKWSRALKTVFTQTAANLLHKGYFLFGTEYGTGQGSRPLVEIVRSLKHFSYLPEEESIAYLKLLETIYTNHHLTPKILDPLFYYGPKRDKQFHPLTTELNNRLDRAADSSSARKKEITIVSNYIAAETKTINR